MKADWSYESMEPDMARACRIIDRFDNLIYSVYPMEASVDGERLASKDYRQVMGTYLLQASNDSSAVANFLRDIGLPVERGFDGLSEGEIDAIFVQAQDVTLGALLRHMVPNENVSLYDALRLVQNQFPILQDKAARARAQLNTDRDTLRTSAGWVPLAERFLEEEHSAEFRFLEEKIYGIPTDNVPVAFILKLLPPLVAGFFVSVILRPQTPSDVALGAAVVAFLLCWPVIVLWNVVVAEQFRSTWLIMFGLYAAYVFAYYFLAKLGAQLGLKFAFRGTPGALAEYVDWNKVLSTTATSLVTSAVVALLTYTYANAG